MSADEFIAARVSPETKARLRAIAVRQQLSESALLKRSVDFMLTGAGTVDLAERVAPQAARNARLMIRLAPEDQVLLRDRAGARGMAPATYVSVLTRAHLRSLAPLPKEELLALKRTLGELGVVGRNLNQIARAGSLGERFGPPIVRMSRSCSRSVRPCGFTSGRFSRRMFGRGHRAMPRRARSDFFFDLASYGRGGPALRDCLTPAQIQQIARTVGRVPEVMVKVLPATAAALRRHVDYIDRKGEVTLVADDGPVQGRAAGQELSESGQRSGLLCQDKGTTIWPHG